MEKFKQVFMDLVVLHDKVHVFHIRTVNMPGCATLHGTLGGIYTGLEENVDTRGEDILQKYFEEEIPTHQECYEGSELEDIKAKDPEDIIDEVLDDIESLEEEIGELNNNVDNNLAELVGPIWSTFTKYCADLKREMCK